jgi:hypothetical protein
MRAVPSRWPRRVMILVPLFSVWSEGPRPPTAHLLQKEIGSRLGSSAVCGTYQELSCTTGPDDRGLLLNRGPPVFRIRRVVDPVHRSRISSLPAACASCLFHGLRTARARTAPRSSTRTGIQNQRNPSSPGFQISQAPKARRFLSPSAQTGPAARMDATSAAATSPSAADAGMPCLECHVGILNPALLALPPLLGPGLYRGLVRRGFATART